MTNVMEHRSKRDFTLERILSNIPEGASYICLLHICPLLLSIYSQNKESCILFRTTKVINNILLLIVLDFVVVSLIYFSDHGRMTLLLGPPGSGKSTLLLALAGKLDRGLKVSLIA